MSVPSFFISLCKANKRLVSLINKVFNPVKEQLIPSPRHVTAIVCAKSGDDIKSKATACFEILVFFIVIELSLKIVSTPNSLNILERIESPCKLVILKLLNIISVLIGDSATKL